MTMVRSLEGQLSGSYSGVTYGKYRTLGSAGVTSRNQVWYPLMGRDTVRESNGSHSEGLDSIPIESLLLLPLDLGTIARETT